MNQLEIRAVTYTEAIESIQMIRRTVFQDEQGVEPKLEFDGLDKTAEHFLAYLNGEPVGTVRVRQLDSKTAKIERLAVLYRARGHRIGTKLMETAIEVISRNQSYQKIIVNAQEYVKSLYEKLGFQQVGNRFDEAGISHIKMVKYLEG